ncbi:hypothetical protein ACQ4M3_24280 [Leptolyngbya sp. AN03gr2]|uniref:hypothetical protein n=1 Tax=unclassified Leptolyngbya TaxID=2650499 RepID=UPI003D3182C1
MSKTLQKTLQSNAFYEQVSLRQYGPLDGGCLIIASALKEIFKLEFGGGFPPNRPLAEHATVVFRHFFIDGNGLSTQAEIERYWMHEEKVQLCFRSCTFEDLKSRCYWNPDDYDRCLTFLAPILTPFRAIIYDNRVPSS